MEGTTDIEGLRAVAARLVGGAVEQVQVPLDGGGRFGLQLRLTRLRDDGTRQVRRRRLAVHAPAWRLDRPDGVVAASGDRERRLTEDLAVLTGRTITGVRVRPLAAVAGPRRSTGGRIGVDGRAGQGLSGPDRSAPARSSPLPTTLRICHRPPAG
ncbi:hypothetical protein AB0C76_34530 [Kitasatospora sp. NPDC048722]|uniref:hypothetical protein n=1 Tax=Kitasatospora sp. NPDC048722 TaxID=3155639 RepID=UPI0033E25D98